MTCILRAALCAVGLIVLYGCLVFALANKLDEDNRRHHTPRIAARHAPNASGGNAAEPVLTGTALPPHPSQVTL